MISIHAPREGCDRNPVQSTRGGHISIHAPREGCDRMGKTNDDIAEISIHAPREGCDLANWQPSRFIRNFNPRTP